MNKKSKFFLRSVLFSSLLAIMSASCAMPKNDTAHENITTQSEQNILSVKKLLKAFSEKNIPTVLSMYAEDIDWFVGGGSEIPFSGKRTNKEQVLQYFKIVGSSLETKVFKPYGFTASGDQVVLQGFVSGIAKKTKKPFEYEFAMVYTIKDDKFTKYRLYFDSAAVAEALK